MLIALVVYISLGFKQIQSKGKPQEEILSHPHDMASNISELTHLWFTKWTVWKEEKIRKWFLSNSMNSINFIIYNKLYLKVNLYRFNIRLWGRITLQCTEGAYSVVLNLSFSFDLAQAGETLRTRHGEKKLAVRNVLFTSWRKVLAGRESQEWHIVNIVFTIELNYTLGFFFPF